MGGAILLKSKKEQVKQILLYFYLSHHIKTIILTCISMKINGDILPFVYEV